MSGPRALQERFVGGAGAWGKVLGIFGLFVAIIAVTGATNPRFFQAENLENLVQRTALFGILGIGAAFPIITAGIDLSIGSVVALTATALPLLLGEGVPAPIAIVLVLALGAFLGLIHGLLITRVGLQPFVVTLCGLLVYRGVARYIVDDQTLGFGTDHAALRSLATGRPFSIGAFDVPAPMLMLLAIAVIAAIFLGRTVWGRWMLALGRNPVAARYAGVPVARVTVLAYVLCSLCAALGGILFALDVNSVQPASMGNFYELYAIAAAVLGGCSLRGGEGSILGVVLGAAVMRLLYNSIVLLGIPSQLEFAIVGGVLLLGAIADELVRRLAERRRAGERARARTERHPSAEVNL
ncbi:MAG: ABC transporter permease [Planctomycetota bacterium]